MTHRTHTMIFSTAVLVIASIVAGCGEAPATPGAAVKSTKSAFVLTDRDLKGAARLTKTEREEFVAACIHGLNNRPIDMQGRGTVRYEDLRREKEQLSRLTPRFCECFCNAFEDRASKLPISIFHTAFRNGHQLDKLSAFTALGPIRAEARALGMSDADFQHEGKSAVESGMSSFGNCAHLLQ